MQIWAMRYYTSTRMLKSWTLTTPNAGEDVQQQELGLLVEMKDGTNAKWYKIVWKEESLAVSCKTKHIPKLGRNQDILQ